MLSKILLLMLAFGFLTFGDEEEIDEKRLALFREKVVVFCSECSGTSERAEIPNLMDDPIFEKDQMPMKQYEGFMEHPATGLRFYPLENVLVDPQTRFSYDLKSYVVIDLKNHKVVGSEKPLCEDVVRKAKKRTAFAETSL